MAEHLKQAGKVGENELSVAQASGLTLCYVQDGKFEVSGIGSIKLDKKATSASVLVVRGESGQPMLLPFESIESAQKLLKGYSLNIQGVGVSAQKDESGWLVSVGSLLCRPFPCEEGTGCVVETSAIYSAL